MKKFSKYIKQTLKIILFTLTAILLIAVLAVLTSILVCNYAITVREYEVQIDGLESQVRIACIADFHGGDLLGRIADLGVTVVDDSYVDAVIAGNTLRIGGTLDYLCGYGLEEGETSPLLELLQDQPFCLYAESF